MTEPNCRLRVQGIIVQPVLVWDDGEEPGPDIQPCSLALSQAASFVLALPGEVAALEQQLAT
ncbi:hypothetical protein ACL9RL_07325 [Plantibacter sp. Mn2098]|uniref:hypothetical protein n=1 Tax=Plantibacter sp. Mn2098 TaxID=3395266 RepID=UPI003BD96454